MKVHSYFNYNNYFKGSLDNLEIWNKGDINYYIENEIPLYTKKGVFYKNEYERTYLMKKDNIKIDPYYKRIIQIDYKFYLIPVAERLEIQDGRLQLILMLIDYGIKGLKFIHSYLQEDRHYSYKRMKYIVDRPLEVCFYDEYRLNTSSFINFSYDEYIKNYKKALINYPDYKDEIDRLKIINTHIICDFYGITEKQLSHKNFNRFEHAMKVLNKKIYQKSRIN